jgi:hypothetical protein
MFETSIAVWSATNNALLLSVLLDQMWTNRWEIFFGKFTKKNSIIQTPRVNSHKNCVRWFPFYSHPNRLFDRNELMWCVQTFKMHLLYYIFYSLDQKNFKNGCFVCDLKLFSWQNSSKRKNNTNNKRTNKLFEMLDVWVILRRNNDPCSTFLLATYGIWEGSFCFVSRKMKKNYCWFSRFRTFMAKNMIWAKKNFPSVTCRCRCRWTQNLCHAYSLDHKT